MRAPPARPRSTSRRSRCAPAVATSRSRSARRRFADWKSQVAYSSPNWNGFSFTAGVTQAWNAIAAAANDANLGTGTNGAFLSSTNLSRGGSSPAFEGKASYEWAGDFGGKVWVSGMSQKVDNLTFGGVDVGSDRANAWDIGATVNVAGFGLTGYYGEGSGSGTTIQLRDGFDSSGKSRDSKDYYVQGTYTIPTVGTKLGLSYGKSKLEGNGAGDLGLGNSDYSNKMWTLGAYHPITKHLNLVAEYDDVKTKIGSSDGKSKTIALGAILFF